MCNEVLSQQEINMLLRKPSKKYAKSLAEHSVTGARIILEEY